MQKRYKFNVSKLLRKKSTNDFNENLKHTKSFFCSELVASVYKNLGLFDHEISASQYWPANFG